MAKIVNLNENISIQAVVALTRNGDEIIIEENGEPSARLIPIQKPARKERTLGLCDCFPH